MSNFRDDETLTDNLDDGQAIRVFEFLEKVEKFDRKKLDTWISIMRFFNRICHDGKYREVFSKSFDQLEKLYEKTKNYIIDLMRETQNTLAL